MSFDYQIFYDYYTNTHQIYPDIFKYKQIPISTDYFLNKKNNYQTNSVLQKAHLLKVLIILLSHSKQIS